MKLSTEEYPGKFGVKHPAFPWLVVHAADVLNKFQVQTNGLTPYENVKGRAYSGLMLEFGSVVLHKTSAKVQGGIMEPTWMKRLWLGKRFGSEEHIVSTPEGNAIRGCAVKPHPEVQWDSGLFDVLKGSPWNPQGRDADPGGEEGEHIADLPRATAVRSFESLIPQARRVLITRDLLERFGHTPGCSKCAAILANDKRQPTRAHNAECRARIERLVAEYPTLKKKLDRASERQDEFLSRRVETGGSEAKRARGEVAEEVRLEPWPNTASESREEDGRDDAMEGEGVEAEGGRSRAASTVTNRPRSRAPSTVTCLSDRPYVVDDEMPVPTAEEQGATASAGSAERPRDSEGESEEQPYQYRQVEDPEVPPDEAGCFEAPECLMLGQRRPKSKVHHDGRYDVCELCSQARVAAEASTMGLRGGWSLDINHVDTITITGETWDLCTERDQRRVWKLLGRDKPLVAGLSPECTLFSQLQNLRKSEIDPEIMAKLIECMKFSVKVAKYKMRRGRFFYF